MIDFIIEIEPVPFIIGMLLLLGGWYGTIMYYHTLRYSIPIVLKIRSQGGKAPTIPELKRFFYIVCSVCAVLALVGYCLVSISMYKQFLGVAPHNIFISLGDWTQIYAKFSKADFFFFWGIVSLLLTCFYIGIKGGARNALAGVC